MRDQVDVAAARSHDERPAQAACQHGGRHRVRIEIVGIDHVAVPAGVQQFAGRTERRRRQGGRLHRHADTRDREESRMPYPCTMALFEVRCRRIVGITPGNRPIEGFLFALLVIGAARIRRGHCNGSDQFIRLQDIFTHYILLGTDKKIFQQHVALAFG